ncbi:MAG: ABC transporter ATP-binding protein/permease [Chloroflexi bacterium]|nr:ABC transporter ATP-binding protein/permease [Chloroflexota bacterium]
MNESKNSNQQSGEESYPVTIDAAKSMDMARAKPLLESARDFWRIMRYALRHWNLLAVIVAFGLAGAALAPAAAFMFAASVDTFLGMVSPGLSLTAQASEGDGFSIGSVALFFIELFGDFVGESQATLLIAVVAGFAGVSLLYQATLFAVKWFSFLAGARSYYAVQRTLYSNILAQPMSFFNRERSGGLISRIHNDVSVTTLPVVEVLQTLCSRLITLAALIVLMLRTSPLVTLIVLAIGGSAALIPALIGRRFQKFMSRQQSQQALVISVIQEALYAVRLVKSTGAEEREISRYWWRAMRMFGLQKRIRVFRLVVERSSEVTTVLALGALIAVGGSLITSGQVSVVEYAAFIFVAREAGVMVAGLSQNLMMVYGVLGASERVVELLNLRPSIQDGDVRKDEFRDSIELRNVSFDYGAGPVLKEVSLTIRRGEFVALVGPSGSGKSTVLDLLLRLQDPTSGQALMDGVDVRRFTQRSYRRLFGVVSQETLLFNDTVFNNISYAAADATQEVVEAAARAANARQFIEEMPEKYQTYLGDRGVRVSGGERQRLAIARALAAEPQILLFDEATSALDSKSERQVQEAIDGLVGTRTAIVVAHRLSTIARADRIYVLDRGQVVESGAHEELKARNGLYASLLRLQSSAYVESKEGVGERVGAASDSA